MSKFFAVAAIVFIVFASAMTCFAQETTISIIPCSSNEVTPDLMAKLNISADSNNLNQEGEILNQIPYCVGDVYACAPMNGCKACTRIGGVCTCYQN